jgi:hypothetical protein
VSQIVRCEICGGIYNRRHLSSHKRLSHGIKIKGVAAEATQSLNSGTNDTKHAQRRDEDGTEVRIPPLPPEEEKE